MKALLHRLRRKFGKYSLPGDVLVTKARGTDYLICDNGDNIIV